MFAVTEDEILFDEILQSGLEAELQRLCAPMLSTDLTDDDDGQDVVRHLDQVADDMWGAYITPVRH